MISNHVTGFATTLSPRSLTRSGRCPASLLLCLVGALCDTAAAATCGVLVDRTALGGAIEDARGLGDGGLRGLAAVVDRVARGLHGRACGGASERLDRCAARRLTDALEGRTLS